MKRKIFIVFMIIFTFFISATLFVSLVCGVPAGSRGEVNRYLFGAAGISIFLPAGFSFFLITTLHLSKKLEEMEREAGREDSFELSNVNGLIREVVNALTKKKNLTLEEKERLLLYIEEL